MNDTALENYNNIAVNGGAGLPLVSVIIRTTGRSELKKALASVAWQTYPTIEVILVDVLGAESLEHDGRCGDLPVRIISESRHLNRGAAANAGIAAARGDMVVFLDDDDWYHDNHVEGLVAAILSGSEYRAAYSGIECLKQGSDGSWEVIKVFNEPYDPIRLLLENYLPMHAVLFDRKLFREQLRFDESLHVYEDWDFWIQLSQLTPLWHVDRITAVYRISTQSGFGVQSESEDSEAGYKALLEKWRHRWTIDQLVAMAGLPARRATAVSEPLVQALNAEHESLAEAIKKISRLESELKTTGPLKDQLADYSRKLEGVAIELNKLSVKEEQYKRITQDLYSIQTSAAWRFGAFIYRLEELMPSVFRCVELVPRVVWWVLSFQLRHRLRLRKQAREILQSGLFSDVWYLSQYPEAVLDGYPLIVHWLDFGWKEGRDPNPLFDSDWYLAQHPEVADSGQNPLDHYLERGAAAGYAPHPLFDTGWYLREYPEVSRKGLNPLADYRQWGAAEGRDPNPLFQTLPYVEGQPYACSPANALAHFYNSDKPYAVGAYRSENALSKIQGRYRSKTKMVVVKGDKRRENRLAVYLQCGAASIHKQWLTDREKPWDLIVNHYDATYIGNLPADVEFKQVGRCPGTKTTSFNGLLNEFDGLIKQYDYIMMLDDDISLNECDITRLFEVGEEAGLDMFQASLSEDSSCSYDVFRHHPGTRLRYTNSVEIMMPIFSRRALEVTRNLFSQSVSGWGIDLVAGKMVRERLGTCPAVIDHVVANHLKPIDLKEGAFYRMLRNANINAEIEMRVLVNKHDAENHFFAMPLGRSD